MMGHQLQSGYCFKYEGKNWKGSSDEKWDTVVCSPSGDEKYVGSREIDGSECSVFKSGKAYYAQMAHMTRVNSLKKFKGLADSLKDLRIEVDYGRKLPLTGPDTRSKIEAALRQFYQGRKPTSAELERAEEEYLAYTFEEGVPRPAWWNWGHLERRPKSEREAYMRAVYPKSRINALADESAAASMIETASSNAPAIVLGVAGAAAIGTAIYYAMKGKPSAALPPVSSSAPLPKPSPSAPAPAPRPTPSTAPRPAPAPAPAPVAPAPTAQAPAPMPRVPTPAEAAPEAFQAPDTSADPGAAFQHAEPGTLGVEGSKFTGG